MEVLVFPGGDRLAGALVGMVVLGIQVVLGGIREVYTSPMWSMLKPGDLHAPEPSTAGGRSWWCGLGGGQDLTELIRGGPGLYRLFRPTAQKTQKKSLSHFMCAFFQMYDIHKMSENIFDNFFLFL